MMRSGGPRNLDKRLSLLEQRLVADPVTLFFEDGTTKEIRGGSSAPGGSLQPCVAKKNPKSWT